MSKVWIPQLAPRPMLCQVIDIRYLALCSYRAGCNIIVFLLTTLAPILKSWESVPRTTVQNVGRGWYVQNFLGLQTTLSPRSAANSHASAISIKSPLLNSTVHSRTRWSYGSNSFPFSTSKYELCPQTHSVRVKDILVNSHTNLSYWFFRDSQQLPG